MILRCGPVGTGLADTAAVGDILPSSSIGQALLSTEHAFLVGRAVDGGAGPLGYGSDSGDVMNLGPTERRLRDAGIDCRTGLTTDDITAAPPDTVYGSRGTVAGAGDTDHGRGMARELRAACQAVAEQHPGTGDTSGAPGTTWADLGGRSSGVLWGVLPVRFVAVFEGGTATSPQPPPGRVPK